MEPGLFISEDDGQWIEVYNWSEVYESSEEEVEQFYSDSTFADWRIEDDQIVVTYKYDEGYVSENDGGFGLGEPGSMKSDTLTNYLMVN